MWTYLALCLTLNLPEMLWPTGDSHETEQEVT